MTHQKSVISSKKPSSEDEPRRRGLRGSSPIKDQLIQLRVSAETKALLTKAADLDGRSLSDYVVRSAERGAIDAVLDRREWLLDQKDFEALLDLLDAPSPPSPDVVERLNRKPPWR